MAQITGLFRIGRDTELRYTSDNTAVASLAMAFDYGKKPADGYRPSQWIDAAMWGKQAESLAQYLTKGKQIYAVIDDPHIEEYDGKNGKGVKLVGSVSSVEFANSKQEQPQEQRKQEPAQKPQRSAQAAQRPSFDDLDSDIPF